MCVNDEISYNMINVCSNVYQKLDKYLSINLIYHTNYLHLHEELQLYLNKLQAKF